MLVKVWVFWFDRVMMNLVGRCWLLRVLMMWGFFGAVACGAAGDFKVVGYTAAWSGGVEDIQYDKLTHINYAFVQPNADGTLKAVPKPERLKKLVRLAHAKGVKVGIAVGGWNGGDDSAFEKLAADAGKRKVFVDGLMGVVEEYDLDGVDMDWEYPDAGVSGERFLELMKELRARLSGGGKFLSTAVVSLGGKGIKKEVFALVDMLNVMAYDGAAHGTYGQAVGALDYWLGRGCPEEKVILGLPFYGRSPYKSYATLMKEDDGAWAKDVVGEVRYNGIAMIEKKCRLALERCGGVMIWELSQDVAGERSLLRAIDRVVKTSERTE